MGMLTETLLKFADKSGIQPEDYSFFVRNENGTFMCSYETSGAVKVGASIFLDSELFLYSVKYENDIVIQGQDQDKAIEYITNPKSDPRADLFRIITTRKH